MWLYHATFKKNLEGIMKDGLKTGMSKNYRKSSSKELYFTTDADVALDYCYNAELTSNEVWESGTVMLAVEANDIDDLSIVKDYDADDDTSYRYNKNIPIGKIYVVTEDDYYGDEGAYKKLKEFKCMEDVPEYINSEYEYVGA